MVDWGPEGRCPEKTVEIASFREVVELGSPQIYTGLEWSVKLGKKKKEKSEFVHILVTKEKPEFLWICEWLSKTQSQDEKESLDGTS